MEICNRHYITVGENGCILNGFSDAFCQPTVTDICINEQGGYQFRLRPGGEENPLLFGEGMIPLYKWDGNAVQRRSQAEIDADISALPAPGPAENGQDDVWAALDAAYREGVDSAYDQ